MARKKEITFPPVFKKILIIGLIVLVLVGILTASIAHFLTHSPYFSVRVITMDAALEFIDKQDLIRLRGKNIFAVNIASLQDKLRRKYPQIDDLSVLRRFPDQIHVTAKARQAVAHVMATNGVLTIDDYGVVVAITKKVDDTLPFIKGLKTPSRYVPLGATLRGQNLLLAIDMVKLFSGNKLSVNYQMIELNVENVARMYFVLMPKHPKNILPSMNGEVFLPSFQVIMDWDNMPQKIEVLGLILLEKKLDLTQVNYIDLRFKDPVIGQKNAKKIHK